MVTIDHVTAVVGDIEAAGETVQRLVGVPANTGVTLPGMAIRSFLLGGSELHLCAPTGAGMVDEHLRRHGPSLHHVALAVDRLEPTIRRLRAEGFDVLGAPVQTAPGLVEVFVDPATTAGLRIQLVQRSGSAARSTLLDPGAVQALAERMGAAVVGGDKT